MESFALSGAREAVYLAGHLVWGIAEIGIKSGVELKLAKVVDGKGSRFGELEDGKVEAAVVEDLV